MTVDTNSENVGDHIRGLAARYAAALDERVKERVKEMKGDDRSHFLVYRVLGVGAEEGEMIDVYQNKGRFLYRYAGSFLEHAARACFVASYPGAGSVRIPNRLGTRPKTFEIDCLIGDRDAIEIKWRDATTDGDHITKEHTRMQNVCEAGYRPIRVMFYYPNRLQAQRIQQTLETLYAGANGEYYYGEGAWDYVARNTGDLKMILEQIATEKR